MLVFRSLTLGLLGACLYMIGDLGGTQPPPILTMQVRLPLEPETTTTRTNHVTVIDVAPNVPPLTLVRLIKLADAERIAAVDDRAVDSDLEAGLHIIGQLERGSRLVDLTVTRGDGPQRRVLVVQH